MDEIFFFIFNLWNEIRKPFLSRLHRVIYKNLNLGHLVQEGDTGRAHT